MSFEIFIHSPDRLFDPREGIRATGAEVGPELYRLLDKIEHAAKAVLDRDDFTDSLVLPHGMPADSESVRADAATIVQVVRVLRTQLAEPKHAALIAWNSLALGRLVERMGVRVFEPNAELGIKFSNAQRKRHETAHGTPAEKQARYAAYQEAVDTLRITNPNFSYNGACGLVAKQFGMHINTIKKHTVNRK